MGQARTTVAIAFLAPLLAACGEYPAWGEVNSIIVATSEEQWAAVGEMVESAMETRVLTVRPEKTFRVTHQVPAGLEWERLQRFKQILLIGTTDSPWMAEALALAERESFSPPELLQVGDVWARGQNVTLLLLPSEVSSSRGVPISEIERKRTSETTSAAAP